MIIAIVTGCCCLLPVRQNHFCGSSRVPSRIAVVVGMVGLSDLLENCVAPDANAQLLQSVHDAAGGGWLGYVAADDGHRAQGGFQPDLVESQIVAADKACDHGVEWFRIPLTIDDEM